MTDNSESRKIAEVTCSRSHKWVCDRTGCLLTPFSTKSSLHILGADWSHPHTSI